MLALPPPPLPVPPITTLFCGHDVGPYGDGDLGWTKINGRYYGFDGNCFFLIEPTVYLPHLRLKIARMMRAGYSPAQITQTLSWRRTMALLRSKSTAFERTH
jgi:hypothetical protein